MKLVYYDKQNVLKGYTRKKMTVHTGNNSINEIITVLFCPVCCTVSNTIKYFTKFFSSKRKASVMQSLCAFQSAAYQVHSFHSDNWAKWKCFPLHVLWKKAKYSVALVHIPGGHHQRTVNGEPLRCKSQIFDLLVSLRESPLQQPIQPIF